MSLGQRMLDEAILPAGARRSSASPPAGLRGPSTVPAMGNLEYAHDLWTVAEPPHDVFEWFQAHIPHGYSKDETESGTDRGVPSWAVGDKLTVEPPNISYAELDYGVAGDGAGGAVVRVDTVVGWTAPRPADELVPATDRVVMLTVVHLRGAIGKRVVATDPKLVQPIVRAFNALRVFPPDQQYSCPAIGANAVSYRVGFAASTTAVPDIVASIGPCGGVSVTVGGRTAPELGDLANVGFGDAVAHLLGLPEPHFG
jgi:hypothetical protein